MSSTRTHPAELATVDETADVLRVTSATIRKKLRSGEMQDVKIGAVSKAHWRIPKDELRQLSGGR